MLSVSNSVSNKFINFIMRNSIKSCLPLLDKIGSLEAETKKQHESLQVIVTKERDAKIELVKAKFANNPDYILKVHNFYAHQEQVLEQEFTQKLETTGGNLVQNWLLNNKNCLQDLVSYTENVALDSFKDCMLASANEQNLSGCENSLTSALEKFL